ncbi:hypothetical protein HY251_21630 [bacterium]|nr:hypothetical protein [bacterium]
MTAPSPTLPGSAACRCGNPGTASCDRCGTPVCSLCLRQDTLGTGICLACRSGMIKLEEFRAESRRARSSPAAMAKKFLRVRRRLIFVPAVVVGALSIATAVAFPLLAEVSSASAVRTERRAQEALHAIYEAEVSHRKKAASYAALDELEREGLVRPISIEGYELRVDLQDGGRSFEAHASPTASGLRGIYLDARGTIGYEAEHR